MNQAVHADDSDQWPLAPLYLPPEQLPPLRRSPAGLGLARGCADGTLHLQVCQGCGAAQYPPRDVCGDCLDEALTWQAVPQGAELLASTVIRHSHFPYFQARQPWRIGTVRLDCGPVAIVHLHPACRAEPGERLRVRARRDGGGMAVLFAEPASD